MRREPQRMGPTPVLDGTDSAVTQAEPSQYFGLPDPEGAPAYAEPRRQGWMDYARLETEQEPGTVALPIPRLGYGGYLPVTGDAGLPGTFSKAIHPQYGNTFNHGLHLAPVARRVKRGQPSQESSRIPAGPRDQRQRPMPLFPGRVTAWPKSVLSWPTLTREG